MAIYYFKCSNCDRIKKRLFSPEEAKQEQHCPHDGALMQRIPQGGFTTIKEVIDNGLQARKAEQFANTNEMIKEREDDNRELRKKEEL